MQRDSLKIVLYPLITEDSVKLIEDENKITFIVDITASKREVTRAVEELYEIEVDKVNTCITAKGKKKAYVKLTSEFKAVELASKLGIL